eukprot:418057-Amphidinium_carterae.1
MGFCRRWRRCRCRRTNLVVRLGVHKKCTVWTDGPGRYSSNPHFRGVGYVTDTGERVWLPRSRSSVLAM